jgi:hypothetical protein
MQRRLIRRVETGRILGEEPGASTFVGDVESVSIDLVLRDREAVVAWA